MSPRFHWHVITTTFLFAGVVGTFVALALFNPPGYVFATYEDLIGEWLQTFGFAATLVLSVLIAVSRGPFRWFFTLLALACFYTVMEEISWGQRLFGFETPELLKTAGNLQGEANLHNLLTGPVATPTKAIIEYLMAAAFVGYGLFYPLTLRWKWAPSLWLEHFGIGAPPLYLWPFFVTAAFLELGPLNFNEAEIAELLIALALAIFAAHYWFAHRAEPGLPVGGVLTSSTSVRLMLVILAMVLAIGACATVTTYAIYNSPTLRPTIDARLLNGYEKFASRYGSHGRWDIAVQLYMLAQAKNPDSAYYMRRIANAFQKMGNETLFQIHNKKALELAARDLARKSDSISANLSLARTYRQSGDNQKVSYYVQKANAIALERVRETPDDAHHNYWLAKTYREMGDYQSALRYYRRAVELNPGSSKYRRAYLEMQRVERNEQ